MKISLKAVFILMLPLLLMMHVKIFGLTQGSVNEGVHHTPENVVAELYKLVSFEAGKLPDWEQVKRLFIEEAVIVLRLGPTTMRTFGRQSFIDYFIMDIERAKLIESGFTETILQSHMQIIKEIAHCYALYEVIVPGRNDDKPVNRGIDSFHLIKRNGRWLIASIINEGFRMDEPIPEFMVKR